MLKRKIYKCEKKISLYVTFTIYGILKNNNFLINELLKKINNNIKIYFIALLCLI